MEQKEERSFLIGGKEYHLREKYSLRRVNTVGKIIGRDILSMNIKTLDMIPIVADNEKTLKILAEVFEETVDETLLDELTGPDFVALFTIFFLEACKLTLLNANGKSYLAGLQDILNRQNLPADTSSMLPSSLPAEEIQNSSNGYGITTPSVS